MHYTALMRSCIFYWCLCFFTQNAFSQTYNFSNYSLDDGLPHGRVDAITQDHDGYLWIAHQLGISKFDGLKFKNYFVRDGLADNKTFSLLILNNNHFIAGHDHGLLTEYINGKFYTATLDSSAGILFGFHQSKKGDLWIASERKGAFLVQRPEKVTELINQKAFKNFNETNGLSRTVTSIVEQPGSLLLITDLGIKQFQPDQQSFSFIALEGVPFDEYTSMAVDSSGNTWIGTMKNGVYVKKAKAKNFEPLLFDEQKVNLFITRIFSTKKGKVIIGTWGGGLILVEGDRLSFINEENGLAENKVRCIFEDREENLWTGSHQNGLSCFKGKDISLFFKSKDNRNNQVNAILQTRNNKIFAGTNAGLFSIDPNESFKIDLVKLFYGDENVEITSLCEDKKSNIWVGTRGRGVFIYNPQNRSTTALSELVPFTEKFINKIVQDADGNLWIGSISGVSKVDPDGREIKTFGSRNGLQGLNVVEIFTDATNKIYVVPENKGINVFNGIGFTALNSKGEQLNRGILHAHAQDDKIWIGTEGNGLFQLTNNTIEKHNIESKLDDGYINVVLPDKDNNLWLGTNLGIIFYQMADKTSRIYERIGKNQRLETKIGAAMMANDGSVWFGSINGLIRFDAQRKPKNTIPVNARITQIQLHFNDTTIENGTELSYKNNHLTFYFSGICFTDPHKVSYRYKLVGLDDKWQQLGTGNYVTFSNLPAGDYTFQVAGCNNDGLWDEKPATFSFSIKPPFYLTWWFYSLLFIFVLLMIMVYVKYREKSLRREKEILETTVKERTKEIIDQKEEIEKQRDEIEQNSVLIRQKNLAITDSIQYAKRIQLASLPDAKQMIASLGDAFIFYRPKDIVSGDFYAFAKTDQHSVIVATADCTGHGVPGAFMSLIGTNLFNQIVKEKKIFQPAEILHHLNDGIMQALKQNETDNHDGMDVAICHVDFSNMQIEFAGANRPLWILKSGEVAESEYQDISYVECFGNGLLIFKPDKLPIGGMERNETAQYTNKKIGVDKGDLVLLFTDGYVDQFGGIDNKKMLTKRLKELLIRLKGEPTKVIATEIERFFEAWKGENDQVDDVLMIGIRI